MKILLLLLKASWQSVAIAAIMGSLSGVRSALLSHDDRYFNVGDRLIKLDYGTIESDRLT